MDMILSLEMKYFIVRVFYRNKYIQGLSFSNKNERIVTTKQATTEHTTSN